MQITFTNWLKYFLSDIVARFLKIWDENVSVSFQPKQIFTDTILYILFYP